MDKDNTLLEYESTIDEILNGLQKPQKTLPSKLFYDERGSKLFDEICSLEEYYPTRTETMIMKNNLDEITSYFGKNSLFVEFGSGSSLKTRLLLSNLNSLAGYVPIDISEEHLKNTIIQLEEKYPKLDIYPLAADYTLPIKMPEVARTAERKICFFPGSTIGNFLREEAKVFLNVVAEECGEGGGLLIGIDSIKDTEVLEAAYNDKKGITAEFNFNILKRLNNEFGFDFTLSNYKHSAPFNKKYNRIEMRLVSLNDHEVNFNSNKYHLKTGEYILTEYSHKYTIKDFEELASDNFCLEKVWTDEREYFYVMYFSVK